MAPEKKKKDGMNNDTVARVSNWGWLIISCLTAIVFWYRLSTNPKTVCSSPSAPIVFVSLRAMIERGVFWNDSKSNMIFVVLGFTLGFVTLVPVTFLMVWYRPVKHIVEPRIRFIRNILSLTYVPLVAISADMGRRSQVTVIRPVTFLIMTVTIYQGVRNVDETLIKVTRVLGAKDRDLFAKAIFPATTPSIITAIRLGVSAALTTLIATESTGAITGLDMRIRSLNNSFDVPSMLLYVTIIGIIGIISEKIIKYLERKFTG